MKIYDISMAIHEDMQVYKNKAEKKPKLTVMKDHTMGSSHESMIAMDLHTGTHIDAPLHMIAGGNTMEYLDLEDLMGHCKVLDFTHIDDCITAQALKEKDIKKGDFILLKTKNSYGEGFDFEFVFLEKSGAAYLKEMGVRGVGIDALGIERAQSDHETHKILLGHGIIIIEGLRLKDVKEGEYTLYALPLKIKDVEAAPARVILVEE